MKRLKSLIIVTLISFFLGLFIVLFENKILIVLFPLISLIVLLFSKKVYGSYFSPIALMGVFWLIPSLSTFFDPRWRLDSITWIVVLGSFIAFCLGAVLPTLKTKHLSFKRETVTHLFWDVNFFDKVIKVLFTVGFIGFLINITNVIQAGGLSLYIERGFRNVELIFGKSSYINYLYILNMLVVPLAVLRTINYGKNKIVVLLGLLSFIFLFFHGIRGTIIFSFLITSWTILLYMNKIRIRSVTAGVLLIFIMFSFVTIGRDFKTFLEKGIPFQTLTDRVYLYIAPNYANLQEDIFNREHFFMGRASTAKLVDIFAFGYIERPVVDSYLIDESVNIGTYLRTFYRDFGFAGIIFIPFLIGFITTFIFLNFLQNPTHFNLLLYSIVATMLTFTFWHHEFLRFQFLYFIALLYFIELLRRGICKNGKNTAIAQT